MPTFLKYCQAMWQWSKNDEVCCLYKILNGGVYNTHKRKRLLNSSL